jgi:hypothetical protein
VSRPESIPGGFDGASHCSRDDLPDPSLDHGVDPTSRQVRVLLRPYANNLVTEVDIGVPERGWPGATPINAP